MTTTYTVYLKSTHRNVFSAGGNNRFVPLQEYRCGAASQCGAGPPFFRVHESCSYTFGRISCTWGRPVVRPLYTSNRDKRNSDKTQTLICGIRKADSSVREVEKIPHLSPSGHCDPLLDGLDAYKGTLLSMSNNVRKLVDVLSVQISFINGLHRYATACYCKHVCPTSAIRILINAVNPTVRRNQCPYICTL